MHVWILADDRAGNVNQLLGIAECLKEPYNRIDIQYTKNIKLPNFMRDKTLVGLTKESKEKLLSATTFPDVVLSAGRRSFPIARWIQHHSQGKTKIVQLMNPGRCGFKQTDLIVLPRHDLYAGHEKNVMIVSGTPHRITQERLAAEKEKFKPLFAHFKSPRVSVLIGGATKDKPFTTAHAEQIVQGIKKLNPASLLITTSRRTPPDVVDYLKKALQSENTFFYAYGDSGENPYFGLMAYADMLVVTGDSMSMCTECCACNVPVFIFAPDEMMSAKHKRFHQTLFKEGYATLLGTSTVQPKGRLNPAFEIAARIKERF